MNYDKRLTQVKKHALHVAYDDTAKLVFFSDCHRNDGSTADHFRHNNLHYHVALHHYFAEGFTYFELGDGNELWENRSFRYIAKWEADTFSLLKKFFNLDRFYMIYDNHDMVKSCPHWAQINLQHFQPNCHSENSPIMPNLAIHEGVLLQHEERKQPILLLHRHQADFFNDRLWEAQPLVGSLCMEASDLTGSEESFFHRQR